MECERHRGQGIITLGKGIKKCYGCFREHFEPREYFEYCPLCGYKWDDPRGCGAEKATSLKEVK